MFTQAVKFSIPVMFGYLPLGAAFGVMFTSSLPYDWYFATLMGLVIYAGAGQFLAVTLLATQASLLEVAIATFALNARHIFFGLSLIKRYQGAGWRKLYLIFGLTDETYSLQTSRFTLSDPNQEHQLGFYITLLNQGYWVLGCTLGALAGRYLTFNSQGIEFTLVALFIVLALEQYSALGQKKPFALALFSGCIALILVPSQHQLPIALLLTSGLLILDFKYPLNKAALLCKSTS
ncbi:4-azaleucine resistance probable transporter AzlC [Allopseudospirillum japonicum]|uniref:4-azaleucine resistance probable transporter AzlC n=1 Tax=Allopseudospirillum japonicum TaxID=64971 RepID=A0A1H6T7W1_9GAMM|nr:AzlC family ABC transporter permease [Allopseudospirillum japonicum]SEI76159.1 4-azaleucine resistance probable transporter AzlC [Allopseudospirillum japonicum]